LNSTR